MCGGWVKIHTKFLEWEWYTDANVKAVFLHLLLTANYEPKRWKGIVIERGQLVTSLDRLSESLNLSIQKVRTALQKLESTQEITRNSTNKYTLLTICKYDKYQEVDRPKQQANQQANNKQITINQQSNNNNLRIEEIKNKRVDHHARAKNQSILEEIKRDTIVIEAMALQNHISIDEVNRLIDDFGMSLTIEHETLNDLQSARQRARYYVTQNLFKLRANERASTRAKADRRRGCEVTATSPEEFEFHGF